MVYMRLGESNLRHVRIAQAHLASFFSFRRDALGVLGRQRKSNAKGQGANCCSVKGESC